MRALWRDEPWRPPEAAAPDACWGPSARVCLLGSTCYSPLFAYTHPGLGCLHPAGLSSQPAEKRAWHGGSSQASLASASLLKWGHLSRDSRMAINRPVDTYLVCTAQSLGILIFLKSWTPRASRFKELQGTSSTFHV